MRTLAIALLAVVFVSSVFGEEDVPLTNWSVPSRSGGRAGTNTDVSEASVFTAVAPCRIADTRNATGTYGGPAFSAGQTRSFAIPSGPCPGIPVAAAYSLNFTVVNYSGAGGWITAYPTGSPLPFTSTVNFGNGAAVANAAIVPASAGSISVYASGSTHVIIDINGYFSDSSTPLNFGRQLRVVTSIAGNGAVVGTNTSSTSGSYTSGVFGSLTSSTLTAGSGVAGYTPEGSTFGVFGVTDSLADDSGGVLGLAFAIVTDEYSISPVGVRGDSDVGIGVLGFTSSTDLAHAGLYGARVDADGIIVEYGLVGTNGYGLYSGGNLGASGTKSFVDPHPRDASKVVRYVALEGPEAGTYFRGRGKFEGGEAVIDVPESFRFVTAEEGLTVHVTPMGGFAQVAVMQTSLDRIVVQATNDVEFTYIVHGVRRGYENFEPIGPGNEFRPREANERMPAHLNENQKRVLIENGTYKSDGTVNLETALRLGWDRVWNARREKVQERARQR